MKVLATLMFIFSVTAFAQNEMEVAYDVISMYQPEVRQKYGKEIHLSIDQTDKKPNSFVSENFNSIEIEVRSTSLEAFSDKVVAATICHEVGHVLGVKYKSEEYYLSGGVGFAVEGEADYFSGKCLMRYLTEKLNLSTYEAQDQALELAKLRFSVYAKGRINYQKAATRSCQGIDMDYPDYDCRVLTVARAIRDEARPSCWYNP